MGLDPASEQRAALALVRDYDLEGRVVRRSDGTVSSTAGGALHQRTGRSSRRLFQAGYAGHHQTAAHRASVRRWLEIARPPTARRGRLSTPRSGVLEALKIRDLKINGGLGFYANFVDPDLVGKPVTAGSYKTATPIYVGIGTRYLVKATILCDDLNGADSPRSVADRAEPAGKVGNHDAIARNGDRLVALRCRADGPGVG